jgi:chromosomal replication initiation ATPase DnaA
MRNTARQLVLDLPHRPALGAEDFLVSAANRAAVDMIDRWPDWPHWCLLVVAPPRAGKTHLANVWRLKSGAASLPAPTLSEASLAALKPATALLVEDLHAGLGEECALFHLLNLSSEHKLSVLFTSRVAPGELRVALPDLRSRLRALPVVSVSAPDEALLRAVLVKHFADRQLAVAPHVIRYIALHMEQSMEAAAAIVAEIDRLALASRRKVTRSLVTEVLARARAWESPRAFES